MKQTKFSMWKDLSFIPCSITLCNALCGLSAIICMISPRSAETTVPFFAILLIFAAMFFDIFDGFAARKLKAESMHGMELDSLSDMLSFGIAPAILIFVTGQGWHQNLQPFHWVAWLAAGFFTVCALWRLAQYNTVALSEEESSKGIFTGLPTPGATAVLCSVLLLADHLGLEAPIVGLAAIAYAFILGFLMVSEFEYGHFIRVVTTGPLAMRIIVGVLFVSAIIGIRGFIFLAFFAVMHIYLVCGLLSLTLLKKNTSTVKLHQEL